MRTRDFSGKCEIPEHRKVIYFMLIQSYFPNALMHDLFPDETPFKYNNQEHLIIPPQTL